MGKSVINLIASKIYGHLFGLQGAVTGLISSVILMFWIGFGAIGWRAQGYLIYDRKPISTDGCPLTINGTSFDLFTTNSSITASYGIELDYET